MIKGTPIEQATFRTVLGHFASGVAVLAGMDEGQPVGLACQSFFSLSLDPPLVAVAPSITSTSWPAIARSGAFCINILTDTQEPLCRVFSTSGADKFDGVGWSPASSGSPRLHDVLAWVDCRIGDVHPAGDHWLVVGEVLDLGVGGGEPLLFYRGGFGAFTP
jgi:3-hydroxy-9,10-secoandrosta-1,3,5(10)-triene-9,17-dione monooxygenase reductase component